MKRNLILSTMITKFKILIIFYGMFLIQVFACGHKSRTEKTSAPNIILILADDLGWTSTSVQMHPDYPDSKSDYIETPNIESLAEAGILFTNGYAASHVCSPTRYSIQFGKTPARLRTAYVHGDELKRFNFDTTQMSIPKMVKLANPDYTTAHFGKWHMMGKPSGYGYDESDGHTSNHEGNTEGSRNRRYMDEWKGFVSEDPKLIYSLSKRANDFMERQVKAGKPFLLQISHYAPHSELVCTPEKLEKYRAKSKGKYHKNEYFAAMVEDLDQGIGMVLDKIKALGIDDDTYVFFLSDNGGVPTIPPASGPHYGGYNYPLSQGKWDITEGGIRVPFIVKGPGIRPGSVSHTPIITYDLLPTIAELVGYSGDLDEGIDGGSFVFAMKTENNGEVKRATEAFIFHRPNYHNFGLLEPYSALQKGIYKLLYFPISDRVFLFNLEKDIGETKNISTELPELTNRLKQELMDYLTNVNAETPQEMNSYKRYEGQMQEKFPFN